MQNLVPYWTILGIEPRVISSTRDTPPRRAGVEDVTPDAKCLELYYNFRDKMDNNYNNIFVDIGQGLSMMVGLPRLTAWKTRGRPRKAKRGTFGFNSQTNSLEYYNGSYWLAASMTSSTD